VTLCAAGLLLVIAAGCGGGTKSSSRVDRCVDKLMARADKLHPGEGHESQVRDYARRTYCAPFAARGFVYADGTLSIGAQQWLVHAGTCATSEAGGTSRTVPCEQMFAQETTIDCGMLHYVRKAEVQKYLRKVGPKSCDDGTPLDELGA
jgi:hypothetical protein